MKLICGFVSRIAGSRVASEPIPAWAAKHLSRCEKCRREVEQYARLSRLLKETAAGDEALSLTWQQLRGDLPARERPVARRMPVYTMAAATAVLVAALWIGMSMQGGRQVRQHIASDRPIVKQPHIQTQNDRVTPPERQQLRQQVAQEQPTPQSAREQGRVAVYERGRPRASQPRPAPESHERDHTAAVAANPDVTNAPDEPVYRVVGAEEHVIEVVGVDSSEESADSGTGYVIQTTGSEEDHQVTLL